MDITISKKRPLIPSFLSFSNNFCLGIRSKAFLKSTKHEKSKFLRFCGLDLTNLSMSVFKMKMLSTVPCLFLKPPCSAFRIPIFGHVIIQSIIEDGREEFT